MSFAFNFPISISEHERRIYFRRDDEPDYGKPAIIPKEPEPEGPWRFVPLPALNNIFFYLPDEDRFNASLVCRSWSEVFNSPNLWRERSFKFYGYRQARNDMDKALAFSKRFGKYLKCLIISCEHPTFVMCKKFQRTITDIIGVLIWRKCQLRELSIPHVHADRYWRYDFVRERMISSLARYLRKQQQLETFDMPSAGLTIQNGLKILEALLTGVKGTRNLSVLNLEDFFHPRLAIFRVGRFLHILNGLKNLSSLYLNYNCISEDTIKILTRNCARSLKFLSIKVYRNDPHFQRVAPQYWRELRQACPRLRVHVYFECIGQHSSISGVLCREIPLVSLQIWTGVHHQDETWHIADTLNFIGASFGKVLEELSLGLEPGRENIDPAFLNMLEKLKQLEFLDVQTTLGLETVETIMEMQLEYKIGLQKCHLNLDSLLPMEVEDLAEIMERYDAMIEHRGLDFRFEANEAILL